MKKKNLKKFELVKVYVYTLDTESLEAWGGAGYMFSTEDLGFKHAVGGNRYIFRTVAYLPENSDLINEENGFWE